MYIIYNNLAFPKDKIDFLFTFYISIWFGTDYRFCIQINRLETVSFELLESAGLLERLSFECIKVVYVYKTVS